MRVGDWGLEKINRWVEKKLAEKSSRKKNFLLASIENEPQTWYVGRPIIIQVNSPALGVSNGDIGICLKDKAANYRIYFLCGQQLGTGV